MRRSSVAVAVFAALLVLSWSSPASAHATFVGAPSGFPTNTDQALTINVPHERDDATYNVDIVVAMPAGWTALSCQSKATWTCSLGTVDGRQVVRFVKATGAAAAEDETFQFAARTAATVGSFAFPTVQTYNTGEIVRWIGAAGTGNPAPMLSTMQGGTAPQTTPSTTNPDATPTTPTTTNVAPPPTTVAVTTAPSTTLTTATASTTASTTTASTTTIVSTSTSETTPSTTTTTTETGSDDGGSANWALLAVIVLASGGGLYAVRRHSQSFRRKTT